MHKPSVAICLQMVSKNLTTVGSARLNIDEVTCLEKLVSNPTDTTANVWCYTARHPGKATNRSAPFHEIVLHVQCAGNGLEGGFLFNRDKFRRSDLLMVISILRQASAPCPPYVQSHVHATCSSHCKLTTQVRATKI